MGAPTTPLLLIPGLLCDAALFGPQIAHFRSGLDITVADHTRADNLPGIARSILAAAPPRFALAGLSMGGYIAFEMLRQAPERITRLALLDANARADRPDQLKQRQVLIGAASTIGVRAVQAMLLRLLIHKDRLDDRALTDRVLLMSDSIGVPAFIRQQQAIMGRPDNRPFLADIKCPTTVIVGEQDALTPVKVAEEIHAGIKDSMLSVIPNCGHLSTLERPEAVNALLAKWLAARPGKRPGK